MAEPSLISAATPGQVPATSQPAGSALDPVPPAVAQVRADPLRTLYPNVNMYNEAATRDFFATRAPLANAATLNKQTREFQHIARDIGATPDEYGTLLSVAGGLQGKKLTDEQRQEMRQETTAAFREKYGDDAGRVFRLAQTLARRDPRLVKFLESSGAGDSSRVALALAEMGLRAAKRGELKG